MTVHTGSTNYVVVRHDPEQNDVARSADAVLEDAATWGYTASAEDLARPADVGHDTSGQKCIAEGGHPTVELALDGGNAYVAGDSDISGNDLVGYVAHQFALEDRVLALYFDPVVGESNYSDDLGNLPATDYGGRRLSDVMTEEGWSDPAELAAALATDIEETSGGLVDVVLEEVTIDEWPEHEVGTVQWHDATSSLKTLPGFTAWTSNTWPCFPHIPVASPMNGVLRYRRACYPTVSGEFAYGTVFQRVVRNGMTVADLVNAGQVDDIWIITEPTSNVRPAALAVPDGDPGYGLMYEPLVIPELEVRVPVMGFSMTSGRADLLRAYAIRAEHTMAAVFNGNLFPSCLVNAMEHNAYNHYVRIRECQVLYGTGNPGSVGTVFASHNAHLEDPENVMLGWEYPDWDDVALSDGDRWWTYPDIGATEARLVDCKPWGCTQYGYYLWWLGHLPSNSGAVGGIYNNLWPYVAQPGCFPSIAAARFSATPAP